MIGNVEFEIDGKKRGFRFGTYAIKTITKTTGIKDIHEIFKRIEKEDIEILLAFFYACAVHYSHHKQEKEDYNEANVSDWIDELGLEKIKEFTLQLLESYQAKNQ